MTALVLAGLMGSGKSTVGALVAGRTGRRLVDVDVEIAARTGRTVRQLWEGGGESAYRHLESEVVLEALRSGEPAVVAAPGGIVLDGAVRAALRQAFVVWLRCSAATAAGRVSVGDHRPLLGSDPLATLSVMARDRLPLYQAVADRVIDTDDLTAAQVVDQVLDLLEGLPAPG